MELRVLVLTCGSEFIQFDEHSSLPVEVHTHTTFVVFRGHENSHGSDSRCGFFAIYLQEWN